MWTAGSPPSQIHSGNAAQLITIVAIIVVPHFIDWTRYKSVITARAKEATGRDLVIDGTIGLSILPPPTLSVTKVRFANGTGGSVPDMATLDSLDLRVALFPLLRGNLTVENVTVVAPKIIVETLPDGSSNLAFGAAKANGGSSATGAGFVAKPPSIQIDRLAIERGTLIYRDASGAAQTVEVLLQGVHVGSLGKAGGRDPPA